MTRGTPGSAPGAPKVSTRTKDRPEGIAARQEVVAILENLEAVAANALVSRDPYTPEDVAEQVLVLGPKCRRFLTVGAPV